MGLKNIAAPAAIRAGIWLAALANGLSAFPSDDPSSPDAWPAPTGTEIGGGLPAGYEPSGAVWHTRLGQLFLVSDDGWVSRMDSDGGSPVTWTPGGDIEGITIADPDSDYLYIGIENPDTIREFDFGTGALTGKSWDLTAWMTGDANQGLEALTYVPAGEHPYGGTHPGGLFYAGLQADGRIYVFAVDLDVSGSVSYVDVIQPYAGLSDISGLHYETATRTLYAVFDSWNLLLEMDSAGTIIAAYRLAGDNQEGVALDLSCPGTEADIFIAEDAGEVWRYEGYPIACAAPTATATPAPSPTPPATPSPSPSATPAPSPSPSVPPSPTPSVAPSPAPSSTPSPAPSSTPAPSPSPTPSVSPAPSPSPSAPPSPGPTASPQPTATPVPASSRAVLGDYNGDGTAELALFRPSTGGWFLRGVTSAVFGAAADIPAPADYDGDGAWDRAVWRPGTGKWMVSGITAFFYGAENDDPAPADYDGDGTAEAGLFRPVSGKWFQRGISKFSWGVADDLPVPGDYDGDGTDDAGIYRPGRGKWFVRQVTRVSYGAADDVPAAADYDGDGTIDIAVFRGAAGRWFVRGITRAYYGVSTDLPASGDYDGDGTADIALFRSARGKWFVRGLTSALYG
nr:SdiA-regulated domain-containing protein [bacterium]